jgi:simple sugar transport system permease protein
MPGRLWQSFWPLLFISFSGALPSLRIRAVGLNPDASRYAGINVPFYQALSLTLAGGFAGLAGVVEVLGVQHRLLEGITGGYGFTGIVRLCSEVCILWAHTGFHIIWRLLVGAIKCSGCPGAFIFDHGFLGLVVLFVVGSSIWSKRWAARRKIEAVKNRRQPMNQVFTWVPLWES